MARFIDDLRNCNFAAGSMNYLDNYPGELQSAKIVVAVSIFDSAALSAIVDTGAPWCIFDPELIATLGIDGDDGYRPESALNIRGTRYEGVLVRAPLTLLADEGDDLTISATIFLPDWNEGDSWYFPNFIGLDGCLNRIRFAVDPVESVFYFGGL
jgi:hypothetical protein